ncbi:MAG: hypothetical protein ACK47E_12090 [Cyclobacteriaceae bacterium]
METHKRILAILHIVSGVFLSIVMLFLSVFVSAVLPIFVEETNSEFPRILEIIQPIISIISTGIIILFAIPAIVGGIALLNNKSWALTLLLVLGCFQLFSFPFGTALGVYSIWVYAEDKKITTAN